MHTRWNAAKPTSNLAALQTGSLRTIAVFAGLIGYAWLLTVMWPETGANAPVGAWAGSGILVLSALVSYALKDRFLCPACAVIVCGTLIAIAFALLGFRSLQLAYFFVVAVIFASVLLGRVGMVLTAAAASLLVVAVGTVRLGVPLSSADVLLPIVVIALSTLASSLSARNLYTALVWAWNEWERARQSQRVVRERRAELRQALKALDEATHRLERANYMLQLARRQADEARRLKQQFAQTISHELRTPLNLIVGFTELMAQSPEYYGGPLPPHYMRDLSVVYRNARHLQGLVNDVLDLARIEAAQMSLVLEETDPAALVMGAVSTVRSLVETRGLSLQTKIEPDLPHLRVDPTRIRQVLFNLLNNAARFTERGGIIISVCRRGEEVVFSVADTGVGIAPDDIPRIFQEFEQLDSSTRRRQEGLGLGLAISRGFVELHGGQIWVESQTGTGSTFSFSLPVQPPELVVARESPSAQAAPAIPARRGEKPILLAVTRSLSAAGLLTRYVRGARTVVAHDLEQAQQVARELQPQAVVVDAASMRLERGHLEALAEAWQLPSVPFVACPLPGEESLRQRFAVDGYLIKPVSRETLWDVLRQFGEDIDEVLVIDDDRDFVRLLSRLLDSPVRRYEVSSAYTAQEGLEMLRRRQPDLLLLDLGLPDMDGLHIVERMRSNTQWQSIPIVIVSGQDETRNSQALRGGVFVTKTEGLTPGEVVQLIQKVVEIATRAPLVARGTLP